MDLRALRRLVPLLVLAVSPTCGWAAIQQQLTGSSTVVLGRRVDGSSIAQRQSFTLPAAGRLEAFWIRLRNPAIAWGSVPPGHASDIIACELRNATGDLLASATVHGFDAAVAESRWLAIHFGVAVAAGSHSVSCANTAASWYVLHGADQPTAYTGGTRSVRIDTGSWEPQEGDLVFAAIIAGPGPCVNGPNVVCIHDLPGDHRFRAEVAFHTELGGGRAGAAEGRSLDAMDVDRGGMFWFFERANPELLLKVLDGCGVNDHRWVFHSAGTNVGFTVMVTDTVSGAVWSSVNGDRTAAPPVQDTSALPCD